MTIKREVIESPITQGVGESLAYPVTTTPWGSSPTSVVVKLYEGATDRSATMLSGSASVLGDVITTPKVTGLTAGHEYRLEVQFTCSGNTYETYCRIFAEE